MGIIKPLIRGVIFCIAGLFSSVSAQAQSSAFTNKPADGATVMDCSFTDVGAWPSGCNWDETISNTDNHIIDPTAPLDGGNVLTECVTGPSGPNYSLRLDSIGAMTAGNPGGWGSVYVAFYFKRDFQTTANYYAKIWYLQSAQQQNWNAEITGDANFLSGGVVGWIYDVDGQDPGINNCQVQGAGVTPYCSNLRAAGSNNIPINTWTKIETYVRGGASGISQDAQLKIWIDGALVRDVSNVNWPAVNGNGFQNVQITNTISDPSYMPNGTSCWYFNHFFVSVNGTMGGSSPVPVPAAPSGLNLL